MMACQSIIKYDRRGDDAYKITVLLLLNSFVTWCLLFYRPMRHSRPFDHHNQMMTSIGCK